MKLDTLNFPAPHIYTCELFLFGKNAFSQYLLSILQYSAGSSFLSRLCTLQKKIPYQMLSFRDQMSPKDPCVKVLVPNVVLLRDGRNFKRWGLVEGLKSLGVCHWVEIVGLWCLLS
jgi:hypothetical protein